MQKTLEEIKALYPTIDINMSGGSDSYQEGVTIIERDPIAVIIKHPTQELYLLADWKNSDWKGFLTGGVEDGDTIAQTVSKEIHEETGYKNVAQVIEMNCVSHGLFFHTVKKVNRLAHYHLVFAQLENLGQDTVSEEEQAIANFIWVVRDEVSNLLTGKDMKTLWNYYCENNVSSDK